MILWKRTVSADFPAVFPNLCGNYAFPQNLHTRKLGKITQLYLLAIKKQYKAADLFKIDIKSYHKLKYLKCFVRAQDSCIYCYAKSRKL